MKTWMVAVLAAASTTTPALAAPTVDALIWDDPLTDGVGMTLSTSSNFEATGDGFRATDRFAVLASDCITLRPPPGQALLSWDYLEVRTSDLDHVTSGTVRVETCGPFPQSLISADLTGCDVIDLSSIPPIIGGIRLGFDLAHDSATATPFASIDHFTVTGTAAGVAQVSFLPVDLDVDAGDAAAWFVTVTGSGAVLPDAELSLDLDQLNNDPSLVSDAHDNDLRPGDTLARPVSLIDVSPSPDGTPASQPSPGSTGGRVVWALGDVPSGTSQGVTAILQVPTGTVDASTLALAARLTTHREPTCPSSVSSDLSTTADSRTNRVTVHSRTQVVFFNGPGAGERIHPGASWTDYVELESPLAGASDRSDLTDVDVTIGFADGTCTPVYEGYEVVWPDTQPAGFRVVDELSVPTSGQVASGPLQLRLPRVIQASDRPQVLVTYSGPDDGSCVDGDTIQLHVTVAANQPEVAFDASHRAQPFELDDELCRSGFVRWPQRVMSGGEVPNDYLPFPAINPQESYLIGFGLNELGARPFSVGPGDWYDMWFPWTNYGTNAPSIAVDASYILGTIPGYATFRGVRDTSFTTPLRAYKDCGGGALDPDDVAFDHADPTVSGWSAVDATMGSPYAPFDATPSDTDPRAIVPSGCRVMLVRSPDDPIGDDPTMVITALMRMCDADDETAGLCAVPADGAEVLAWSGEAPPFFEMFVWHDGDVTVCDTTANVGGAFFYLEEASWPRTFLSTPNDTVPPGSTAEVVLQPHNENQASRPALAVWGVDLFEARDDLDLSAVGGFAALPALARMPTGSSVFDITFHPPDVARCHVATDPLDPACLAWFEVPDDAQPPNYWGVADPNQKGRLDAVDTWEGHVLLPLLGGIDGTQLDLGGQARAFSRTGTACTSDAQCGSGERCATGEGVCWAIGDLGAANSSPRYTCGDLCDDRLTLTVADAPSLTVRKEAPAQALAGTVVPYTITLTNNAQSPVSGWWLVDQVPSIGISGGDVTGVLGRAFVDVPPGEVVIETSDVPTCARRPDRTGTNGWTAVAVEASTTGGFLTQTVDPLDADACVRVRAAAGAAPLAAGSTLTMRLDATMPGGTPDGQRMVNVALGGAATAFGASREVPGAAAPAVFTKAGGEPSLDLSKSGVASRVDPGLIVWTLTVRNTSAVVDPLGSIVVDCLPDGVDLVRVTPPNGGSCEPADCTTAVVTSTCPSGQVTVRIPTLPPNDNQAGGPDEISFTITTRVTTATGAVINTATATTRSPGTGDTAQATVLIGDVTFTKTVQTVPPNGTSNPVAVQNGGRVLYTLVATNNDVVDRWFVLRDAIPDEVVYQQGTIQIDGVRASESLVRFGRIIELTSPTIIAPGGTLTVTFQAVADVAQAMVVTNVAVVAPCADPAPGGTCATAVSSNEEDLLVEICGDSQVGATEGCDDGNDVNEDGCSDTCVAEICGDGIIQVPLGEACDDGNAASDDGCSASCVVEFCGDAVVQAGIREQCDDGNDVDGDGCSAICELEGCGDGLIQAGIGEQCDDGNDVGNDGCSATCQTEFCGDGVVHNGINEQCDDGNTLSEDGCSSTCRIEVCGDGVVQTALGEQCDDGNVTIEDGCSDTCRTEFCGDGTLQAGLGEQCDDGNTFAGDGCDADCLTEAPPDTDTDTDTDVDTDDTDDTDGPQDSDTVDSDTGGDGKDDGCNCTTSARGGVSGWLVLVGLAALRRRRR